MKIPEAVITKKGSILVIMNQKIDNELKLL